MGMGMGMATAIITLKNLHHLNKTGLTEIVFISRFLKLIGAELNKEKILLLMASAFNLKLSNILFKIRIKNIFKFE
jgi:hypothetical protein